jgi:hypothetical protein
MNYDSLYPTFCPAAQARIRLGWRLRQSYSSLTVEEQTVIQQARVLKIGNSSNSHEPTFHSLEGSCWPDYFK